jgi:hypothetical protein
MEERKVDYRSVFFTSEAGRRVFVDLCKWAGWLTESTDLDPIAITARRDAVTRILKCSGIEDLSIFAEAMAYASVRAIAKSPVEQTQKRLEEGV